VTLRCFTAQPVMFERPVPTPDRDGRRLFVRGLPYDATDQALHDAFIVYGAIDEAIVMVDRMTGRGKGFGFVTFTDDVGATAALITPDKLVGGRMTHCNLAIANAGARYI
jgi:heterogeneous nuclear ribonucleoprotein A1/A3